MNKNNLQLENNINRNFIDNKILKKYEKNIQKIFQNIIEEINEPKKTLNVLSQKYEFNFKFKDLKSFKNFKKIAFIGMGGSILGAEAISSFLGKSEKRNFYFFDNIDEKKISNFKKKENLKKILFLIISKSGNTIETLANVSTLNILKKNAKNIIVITERKNSLLYSLKKKFNLFYVEHKNFIGGRYSVLSEVGIIPAYLMGKNIYKLRSEIRLFLKGKLALILKDSSIKLASILKKNFVHDLILVSYIPEIEKFLYWCQQLIAESLGKKNKGFLPVVSTAPKDHHSLLQLYLDGPKNKLFYIFSFENKLKNNQKIQKKNNQKKFLNNKNLLNIKTAQKEALIKVFKQKKISFREFKIKEFNEEVLGQLFSYFILETIIIGQLVNINPYNQPAVEQVKTITKKILN